MPFPQERYDQVFVPNLGGAMENWGCVTWTDGHALPHAADARAARSCAPAFLLHEMAHMWFGDLVTMRWWDDLWLNEAFASWAATWAAAVGDRVHRRLGHLPRRRADRTPTSMDMGPATHPIRGDVPDVDARDRELRRDHLRTRARRAAPADGLRRRGRRSSRACAPTSREHAWGNTAPGRPDAVDRRRRRPRPDGLDQRLAGPGRHRHDHPGRRRTLLASSPDGGEPRAHRAADRLLHAAAPAGLERAGATSRVETTGTTTYLLDLPAADLHLLNAGDLTFAAVRTDESSLQVLLAHAGDRSPSRVDRALAVAHRPGTCCSRASCPRGDLLDCLLVAAGDRAEPQRRRAVPRARAAGRRAVEPGRADPPAAGPGGRGRRAPGRRARAPDRRAAHARLARVDRRRTSTLLDAAAARRPRPGVAGAGPPGRARRLRRGRGPGPARARPRPRRRDLRALGVSAARPPRGRQGGGLGARSSATTVRSRPGPPVQDFASCFWRPGPGTSCWSPWAHRYLEELADARTGRAARPSRA